MLRLAVLAAVLVTASSASAMCIGSETLQTCTDTSGNTYTTSRFGNMSSTTGRNLRTGSSWSSDTTTYGNMSSTTGSDRDGNRWNMDQTDLGNGWSSYSGRDSDGNSFSGMCGPLGCD